MTNPYIIGGFVADNEIELLDVRSNVTLVFERDARGEWVAVAGIVGSGEHRTALPDCFAPNDDVLEALQRVLSVNG